MVLTINDPKSVGRLIEQGAIHVQQMSAHETRGIFETAHKLFKGVISFKENVVEQIVALSEGFPYFAQLIGKASVQHGNEIGTNLIDEKIFEEVLEKIRTGKSFPHLEEQYQLAVGKSKERAMLLALLAEQKTDNAEYTQDLGRVVLQKVRSSAQELDIDYMDQLMPRLVESRYGPALVKGSDQRGVYEFSDPVFRAYIKIRRLD